MLPVAEAPSVSLVRLMGTRTCTTQRSFPRLHSLSDYSLASNEEQRVIPVPGAAPSRQTLLPVLLGCFHLGQLCRSPQASQGSKHLTPPDEGTE